MKILALIPARGGSKRIPKKNIKDFLGKPIISYSIEAALKSKIFDEVMVSTDDNDIANISKKYGAVIPFTRSSKNSDDFSTTADVILEVIDNYKEIGKQFDYICCIYPTAPFLNDKKIIKAFQKLIGSQAISIVPIVKFSYPILRSFKLENDFITMNWPEYINSRSQDLPDSFHDAGQFYFFKTEDFVKNKKIFTDKTLGLEVPETEVQDIDNLDDWRIAEIKYKFILEANKLD
ncbi:MAG: pseudaminic acid cytidylyltransferase [Candidatus Sericytochromatia bacterium]